MKSGRAVVVGGGAVGSQFHVPRILGLEKCTELFVVDTNNYQRERLQSQFRNEARVNVVSRLPPGPFDLAVVATPPKFHLDYFQALCAGCQHIVIEKPLAVSPEEARSISAEADRLGIQVYVGLIRRSLSSFAMVKSWIESQLFGKLVSLSVAEGMIFDWGAVSGGSFSRDLNGGGVLMDTGPHVLDQLYQVFSTVNLVSARLDALPEEGSSAVEANATLRFDCDGIPASVLLSRNRSLSNSATFHFEKAAVKLGLHSDQIQLRDREGNILRGVTNESGPILTYDDLFTAFYRNFVLARNNEGISAAESVRLQDLIANIYNRCQLMEDVF